MILSVIIYFFVNETFISVLLRRSYQHGKFCKKGSISEPFIFHHVLLVKPDQSLTVLKHYLSHRTFFHFNLCHISQKICQCYLIGCYEMTWRYLGCINRHNKCVPSITGKVRIVWNISLPGKQNISAGFVQRESLSEL